MAEPIEGVEDTELVETGTAPASISVDGQTVTERPVSDLIDLDRYLRGKNTAKKNSGNPFAGLRFGVISPPGTQGA